MRIVCPSDFRFIPTLLWPRFVSLEVRAFSYRGKSRGRLYHLKTPIVNDRVSSEVSENECRPASGCQR